MQNRLSSGKPCANGGTELTLIGYFTMSEGLALRFGSDVSGNANIATIGVVSFGFEWLYRTYKRTLVTASNLSGALIYITSFVYYYNGSPRTCVGFGSGAVMHSTTANISITYYDSLTSALATGSCSVECSATGITQGYTSDGDNYYCYPHIAVLYF